MKAEEKRSHPLNVGSSFFLGLLISLLLCMLYLKLGYVCPVWLQPTKNLQNFFTRIGVDIFTDKQNLKEVQRMIAMDLGWNPQTFIDLDTSLEHFISEEYYWKLWGKRKIMILQNTIRAIKDREGKFPTLQDSFNRVLSDLPKDARSEHLFIRQYLKERFPGNTDAEIIEKLAINSTDEILQRPSVYKAIHFQPHFAGKVSVEIIDDSGEIVRRLIDAILPAGHYWVYWDRRDDNGRRTFPMGRYSYRVRYKDNKGETGTLRFPIFQ